MLGHEILAIWEVKPQGISIVKKGKSDGWEVSGGRTDGEEGLEGGLAGGGIFETDFSDHCSHSLVLGSRVRPGS